MAQEGIAWDTPLEGGAACWKGWGLGISGTSRAHVQEFVRCIMFFTPRDMPCIR
jgi:hypothetical protein